MDRRMHIQNVTNCRIVFSVDGTNETHEITFWHHQDCCEDNYADFSTLTENVVYYDYAFNEKLDFEAIDEMGFRFGSDGKWIFIPCYSEQNGYYTDEINIDFDNETVLSMSAKQVYRP